MINITLKKKYGINNRLVRFIIYVFHDRIGLDVYPDIRKNAAIKKLPKYTCP